MTTDLYTLTSDSPAIADMKFWRIVGHETFSRASCYELTVLSEKRQIAANAVLGHSIDLQIDFYDAQGAMHSRHCQGVAVRFARLGQMGRYYEYRIQLRSWFWLLTKRVNSRILQDSAVLAITDSVIASSAISSIAKTQTDAVIGTHEPRRYCVQHQEHDNKYLSRLYEDEGIYYWFDAHTSPDTMHLSDNSNVAHPALAATAILPFAHEHSSEARHASIFAWTSSSQMESGRFSSRDIFYEHIKTQLSGQANAVQSYEIADLEVFEYPGLYLNGGEAQEKTPPRGEQLQSSYERHWALTHWPDVGVGRTFTFKGDPDGTRDGKYLIASCTLVVTHPGYEGMDQFGVAPLPVGNVLSQALSEDMVNCARLDDFVCLIDSCPELNPARRGNSTFLITCLPAAAMFRPARLTDRVMMPGPQTAIVVGAGGEELHVDSMGRVKVQFFWDRYGVSDENSTCWIRVSQPWAGKGWGGYFAPRVGQEVLVDFVNGDPDRPVIIGRLYNDDQPIPYPSPTQSGFLTRSTPGGTSSNCNEFRFEDKIGAEQVYLHAERDQCIEVEHDETHSVDHDRSKTIGNDETTKVVHNRTESVGNNEDITIGVDRREKVGNNETITIGVDRKEAVGSNEVVAVGQNRKISVGASESKSVAVNRLHDVGSNEGITIGVNQDITVGSEQSIKVGASQKVMIGQGQTVTVGEHQEVAVGLIRSITVGVDQSHNVAGMISTTAGLSESRAIGRSRNTSIGHDDTLAVGKRFNLTAEDSISLICGESKLIMKKDGAIELEGKNITVKGSGTIHIKANGDVVVKGKKVLNN